MNLKSSNPCISCRKPQTTARCGLCNEAICKSCKVDLPRERLSLLMEPQSDLSHAVYCPYCYGEKVEPGLTAYDTIANRARGVFVFFSAHKAKIPLLNKSKEVLRVLESEDRDLALMGLAYQAAARDCNALVGVDLKSHSTRDAHGYKSTSWSALGFPANVDAEKIDRYAF